MTLNLFEVYNHRRCWMSSARSFCQDIGLALSSKLLHVALPTHLLALPTLHSMPTRVTQDRSHVSYGAAFGGPTLSALGVEGSLHIKLHVRKFRSNAFHHQVELKFILRRFLSRRTPSEPTVKKTIRFDSIRVDGG